MKKINKTEDNPYGLTNKQLLVIDDMVANLEKEGHITPVSSTSKFYNVSSKASAAVVSSKNMKDPDFRAALIEKISGGALYFGEDPVIDKSLREGLTATTARQEIIGYDEKGKPVFVYVKDPDYKTRLSYIQELNKIAGVYAPEKKVTKTMKYEMTEEEVEKRILELQEELSG